ncbi:MAG TPA: hypothetical protein PK539_00965 [Candidatus Paceibacterota bacterium]|nr:hypothetical protein [Candidatus Paceibacterota bacterium]
MHNRHLSTKETWLALLVGVLTGAVLFVIAILQVRFGISPFPKLPALAFASTLLGAPQPPLVGLLFHLVYVTFWSYIFVAFFRSRSFLNALWLALALAILVFIIFFPYIGWGFFGLAIGKKLIVGALVSHLLFAIVLWLLVRLFFGRDNVSTPTIHADETPAPQVVS